MSKKKKTARTPHQTMKAEADKRRAAKKDAILAGTTQNKKPMWLIAAVCAVIVGAGGYAAFQMTAPSSTPASAVAAAPASDSGSSVTLPVAMFEDGVARHYELAAGDTTIKYFVLKSSDGVIRAAFDACDVCWPAGRGYFQQGDEMVCRNCGRRFASVLVNEVKGGCNPAPLRRRVQGDSVVIETADIIGGRTYFDFSKGA